MERMLARIAAVLAVLVAPVAAAQLAPAAPSPTVPPRAVTPAPAASAADPALTFGLADDRMTVPVSIDRRGSWPFIVDTGAERSVVSSELAGRLGLAAGPMVRVVAMAGPKVVPSALVPALSVSSLPATDVVAPAFAQSDLGAPGMLGIDALQGHRLDIDFDHRSMTLHPSRRHHVTGGGHDDEVVVVARSMLGQLIVTDAHWRGRRVAVVIDTGSGMTLGNPALQRLIAARAKRLGTVVAKAVTGETLTAEATTIGELTLGKIVIAQMPVAFTDAPPFRRFGLERRPAVMLGMDALRLFRRVRIDFANRAIEFQLPAALLAPQPGQPSA